MNYCSVQDVRNALAADGATSGTNTAADMDDDTLTDAINEASSIFDTYVGGPYAVSDSVPNMVIYWTRDVAAFLATCTWRRSKDFEALDPVLLRYQQAVTRMSGIFLGLTAMPSSQMPTADTFMGVAFNLYQGQLFDMTQFDLTGEASAAGGDTIPGWPVFRIQRDKLNWQWPGFLY